MNKNLYFNSEEKKMLAEIIEITIKKIIVFRELCEKTKYKMINILSNLKACYCGKVYREYRVSNKDLQKLLEIIIKIKKLECTNLEELHFLEILEKVLKNMDKY